MPGTPPSVTLPRSLAARGSDGFATALKGELEALGAARLPLQQGLRMGSHVLDHPIQVMVIGVTDEPGAIRARVGVFFSGILAGCSCADDPTPVEAQGEYCELALAIDPASGIAAISVLGD